MGRSDPIKSIGLNVKVYLYDADKKALFYILKVKRTVPESS